MLVPVSVASPVLLSAAVDVSTPLDDPPSLVPSPLEPDSDAVVATPVVPMPSVVELSPTPATCAGEKQPGKTESASTDHRTNVATGEAESTPMERRAVAALITRVTG